MDDDKMGYPDDLGNLHMELDLDDCPSFLDWGLFSNKHEDIDMMAV